MENPNPQISEVRSLSRKENKADFDDSVFDYIDKHEIFGKLTKVDCKD
jgi:hypothetical protein